MALLSPTCNILTNKSSQERDVDGAHSKYGRMEEKEVKFRVLVGTIEGKKVTGKI